MVIIRTLEFAVDAVVNVAVTAAVLLVGYVVGYYVDDNLDALSLSSRAHALEVVLGAEPCFVSARDTDTERLIELPPLTALVTIG